MLIEDIIDPDGRRECLGTSLGKLTRLLNSAWIDAPGRFPGLEADAYKAINIGPPPTSQSGFIISETGQKIEPLS